MIFDYFFFKLYNHYLNSKVLEYPRFLASGTLGLLINMNLGIISIILTKFDILPFIYPDNKPILYMSTPVIAAIVFSVYNKSRIEAIKLKFSEDVFKLKKRKLNIAFTLYILLTILSVLIVPWIKPGYFPKWYL